MFLISNPDSKIQKIRTIMHYVINYAIIFCILLNVVRLIIINLRLEQLKPY